jgi:integrase/recombinase XerD
VKPGELRVRLERYVALRRAVGFPMRNEERMLRDFVTFVERRGLDEAVRSPAAVEWACHGDHRGPTTQARRLSVVRGFLAHVRASVPQTEVPPVGLVVGNRRPIPYIYTDQEIRALVEAARQLGPTDSLRPHTHATIIGLLAASGLRAGEITRLRLEDVRLEVEPPHLRVLDTKFHKSRLVPLHSSTAAALRAYAAQRSHLGYDGLCDRFFVSERPGAIAYQSIRRTFVRLVRRLGLGAGTQRLRLHDLRHTFAVRRLLTWYREGADVRARLPELSVYLGHLKPEDTYWYLSAVPELLGIAAQRFERFADVGGLP